jgi:hypothetical protein
MLPGRRRSSTPWLRQAVMSAWHRNLDVEHVSFNKIPR